VNNVNVLSECDVSVAMMSDDVKLHANNNNAKTHPQPFVQPAFVGDKQVTLLRDTGADLSIIRSNLVGVGDYTGSHAYVRAILSRDVLKLPLAKVMIKSPLINGTRCFAIADADVLDHDVIIGNDLDTDCAASLRAVTRLKTGICIKKPARYLDGDVDPDDIIDDNFDIVDDHNEIVASDIDDRIVETDDNIIDDSSVTDIVGSSDVRPDQVNDGNDIMGDVAADDVEGRPDYIEPTLFLTSISRDEFCRSQRNDPNLARFYDVLEDKESDKEGLV
jgi:hypothetical protein